MPSIYLSPSTQESNIYITGGSEEHWMNLLADELEPYLRANHINFERNTPQMTAASSIRASNAGNFQLHLALHSNAAPPNRSGQVRGSDIYYYPSSVKGQRAANFVAERIREIYPIPDLVRTIPTTSIGEVRQPKAPSVFVEIAYHDNLEDATWITENLNAIAAAIAQGLVDYFGTTFAWPITPRIGTVVLANGSMNTRSEPNTNSTIVATAADGDQILIVGEIGDWYSVEFGNIPGFASKAFIR